MKQSDKKIAEKKKHGKQITLYMANEMHQTIKLHAVKSGTTMVKILLKWVESGIRRDVRP